MKDWENGAVSLSKVLLKLKNACFTQEETAVVAIVINERWNVGDSWRTICSFLKTKTWGFFPVFLVNLQVAWGVLVFYRGNYFEIRTWVATFALDKSWCCAILKGKFGTCAKTVSEECALFGWSNSHPVLAQDHLEAVPCAGLCT